MKKDIWMLASIGVIALSIWGVMIFTVFFDEADDSKKAVTEDNQNIAEFNDPELDKNTSAEKEEMDEAATGSPSSKENKTEHNENINGSDLSQMELKRELPVTERGILPGEFTDITSQGRTSIDDLLERIKEETSE